MQLALFSARKRHLTLTELAEHDLSPAMFYFAQRELAAGRPAPKGLTTGQLAFVEELTFR